MRQPPALGSLILGLLATVCTALASASSLHAQSYRVGGATSAGNPTPTDGGAFIVQPPILDAHATLIQGDSVTITGRARDAFQLEVSGPNGLTTVPLNGDTFSVSVPVGSVMGANRVNPLYFTAIAPTFDLQRSAPATTYVTHDAAPPSVFIDFPEPGQEITTPVVDVMGRVGDLLSGYNGLTVLVNGLPAEVSVGTGNNGTFVKLAVPLALGRNSIEAIATDAVGNPALRTIQVTRVEIPAGSPSMQVISGNGQAAVVGSEVTDPIRVRVLRGNGQPFAGKVVTFHVTRNDGRLAATQGSTVGSLFFQAIADAQGYAEAWWRVGGTAGQGNNRVEVTSQDVLGSVFFCASSTPGTADQINIGSGHNQRAEVGTIAPEPLRVWVSDSCNAVAGIPLTFRVVQGDGSINSAPQATVNTDPTGHAQVPFRVGVTPGPNVIEAQFAGNPTGAAVFTVYGLARDASLGTRFSGLVLDNASQPIGGATCTLVLGANPPLVTTSNEQGQFRFSDLPASGSADMFVNGRTATLLNGQAVPPGSFPELHYEPVLVANAGNSLGMPALLPRLNPVNERTYTREGGAVLECAGVDGLRMYIAPNSMWIPSTYTGHDFVPAPDGTIVSVNQVHHDDIPMPMPDGAAPPFAWTVQPAGARFDPPIRIEYPNMSALPAGAIANFLSFDHDTGRFEVVSSARVRDDGTSIDSDPGQGLSISGWGGNCPPYSVTADVEAGCPYHGCPEPSGSTLGGGQTTCDCAYVSCGCDAATTLAALLAYNGWTFLAAAVFLDTDLDLGDLGCASDSFYLSLLRWRAASGAPLVWPATSCLSAQVLRSASFRPWLCRARQEIHDRTRAAVLAAPNTTIFSTGFTMLDAGVKSDITLGATEELQYTLHNISPSRAAVLATVSIVPQTGAYSAQVRVTITDPFDFACGDLGGYVLFGEWPGIYLQNCGEARTFDNIVEVDDCFAGAAFLPLLACGPPFGCSPGLQGLSGDAGLENRDSAVFVPTIKVGSQVAAVWPRTTFRVANVSAPDLYGASGQGSPANGVGDDPVRAVLQLHDDPPLFAYSQPFYLRQGITSVFSDLTYTTSPPPLPLSIDLDLDSQLLIVGQSTQSHATALLNSGNSADVTGDINWTIYRSSAPSIASVTPDGQVTGAGVGSAFITAINGSVTAVRRIDVTAATVATTVSGFVQLEDGTPVLSASLSTIYGDSGVSVGGGAFSFAAQLPSRVSTLLVRASVTLGGVLYQGASELSPIVAGGITDTGVVILRPGCDGPLFPNPQFAVGLTPISVSTGDLNGDGDNDLAVANTGSNSVSVLLNQGNGTFAAQVAYGTGINPNSLAIGDLDGDGDSDMAVANTGSGSVSVLLNQGNGTFATQAAYSTGIVPLSVAIGDLDGDGDNDLAVANTNSNSVSVLLNAGNGTFAAQVTYGTGLRPRSVAIGDLDGDGDNDLAVANSGSHNVSVLLNAGNGSFAAQVAYSTGTAPWSLAIGDLEGDGDNDLAVANTSSNSVSVLLNAGNGTFAAQVAYGTGLTPISVAIGDLDGDGENDLAVANVNSDSVSVLLNQGNGTFSPQFSYGTGFTPSSVSIGDLDGDGDSDLAAANASSNSVSVLLNQGNGTSAQVSYGTGLTPRSVSIGDLDGDGDRDLAVANSGSSSGSVSVLLNAGNGTFAAQVAYGAGSQSTSVAIGDLDGDGDSDLAVAHRGSFSGSVSVLLNAGNGTFAAQGLYGTGLFPRSVAIGDLDGDGDSDLVVANFDSSSVSVLLSAGNGTFAAQVAYGTGSQPTSVAIGDLDGDGDSDLAVSKNSGSVSVLLNQGNGTFAAQATYDTGSQPLSVAIGDLDGDGDSDMAVANTNSNSVSVLLNAGNGFFTAQVALGTGLTPSSVSIGDLDGDGDSDLAAANTSSNSVSVLLNQGNGTFAAQVPYGTGSYPNSVAIGDLDGDGDSDLAAANTSSNSVSVLLNGCH